MLTLLICFYSCLLLFCFGSSPAVTLFDNAMILSNFALSLSVFSVFMEVVCGTEGGSIKGGGIEGGDIEEVLASGISATGEATIGSGFCALA